MNRFSKHILHVIFSTKYRKPTIPPRLDARLHAYMGGIMRRLRCRLIKAGGSSDHRHLLFELHASVSLSEVMRSLKAGSSKWLSEVLPTWNGWQEGYGVFTVCGRHQSDVESDISTQRERHEQQTLDQEIEELTQK